MPRGVLRVYLPETEKERMLLVNRKLISGRTMERDVRFSAQKSVERI